jgi:N6-L-threonylcarbamoyladenine synthase
MFRKKTEKENFQLIVAGGVAANQSIRAKLSELSNEMKFKTIYPDLKFCGDNAAMIAWAGIQRFKKNLIDNVDVSAKSRWPLDKNAPYMKGPGLKL